jgi:hypothetical protein
MSRKPGTPNKPKVEITKEDVKNFLPLSGKDMLIETMPKYFMLVGYKLDCFNDDVNLWIKQGYECQGGVSVTNYRADNGSIVMVYCQALVKK